MANRYQCEACDGTGKAPEATPALMQEYALRPAMIRDAMQDLLNAPKGVVPESAEGFYDEQRGRFSTALIHNFLREAV